ncbi:MAG: GntR family transcriptional regulator [Candidatus Omnitrophica bacterium]|nr:GntR family transcriptional regulator [Candidatus Omnitrophota bacterium]
MLITIDPTNGAPIFQQVVQQVKYKIAGGVLKEGDQLPSVRELAGKLRINPNTVAKAYAELERAGIIVTRRGLGCYVGDKSVIIKKNERLKIVSQHIERALMEAYHLDIPLHEVEQLFQQEIDKIQKRRQL